MANDKSKIVESKGLRVSVVPKGGCLTTEEETPNKVISDRISIAATAVTGTLTTVDKTSNEND